VTLKQLEAFYWAATCSTFAMAAERVHLSVSSLSKRIVELEMSLGQSLFDRGGHRATLTDAGTRLLPLAGALLQQADRLRQDIGGAQGLRGPCRIGVGELTALTWLPRLVNAIDHVHPKLDVSIHVDIGDALAERLDRGELDVAVIAGRSRRGSLLSTPMTHANFTWCARPDVASGLGAMDAAALQVHRLVTLPQGSGVTHIIDEWLRQAGALATRRVVCNHWGAIVGMLVDSGGIGLLPVGWAAALRGRGVLEELHSPFSLGALDYALHSRRDDLRPLVQALRDITARVADFTVTSSVF
jgi:DNA-binding transcriptional LysR family regulator